jgi:hypothetical protein
VLAVEHVNPPGDDVAVYEVIAEPPSDDGALQASVALAFPATALFNVGAPGTVAEPFWTVTVTAWVFVLPAASVAISVNVCWPFATVLEFHKYV